MNMKVIRTEKPVGKFQVAVPWSLERAERTTPRVESVTHSRSEFR
jgi:hypothetical protein